MAIYSFDTCESGLELIFCDDDSGPGSMPALKQYGIPAGNYFIRFWNYEDNIAGNFGGICVAAIPTISTVENDNCFAAIPFPSIPIDGSCASVVVNTEGANGDPIDLCDGIADDDVWYTFVVPDGIEQILFSVTSGGEPYVQTMRVTEGSCGFPSHYGCFLGSEGLFSELVPGDTYYIRTYTVANDDAAQYEICLRTSPPPAIDEPCGAQEIIVEETANCIPATPVAWEFASDSESFEDPGCGSYLSGDVWFRFELTFTADIVINTAAGSGSDVIEDGAMALYKQGADCDELIYIVCNDDPQEGVLMPALQDFAVEPGIYFIRFWDYHDAISGNIGGVCVAAIPTISTADNDKCEGAIPFPVIPTDGSCSSVHVNNEGSTGSLNATVPGNNDDDLWYSFVVPQGVSTLLYEVTTLHGNAQHYVCLFDECGSSFDCTYAENGRFDNLIEGETYILSVYTAELNVFSEYSVCLKTPPPPPANDECAGATPLIIPLDGSCVTGEALTTWATLSGIFPCGNNENDVWFSFVMPENETSIVVSFSPDTRLDEQGVEFFTGECGNLTSVFCVEDYLFESLKATNLIPGQLYYVRTFTGDPRFFDYNICLQLPPAPPANDECPEAIPFPVIPTDGSCVIMTAVTHGATGNNEEVCDWEVDDDVWFSFVQPDGYTGVVISTNPSKAGGSMIVSVYGGPCDDLVWVGCQDGEPGMILGLVGGETYYVRTYSVFSNISLEFDICIGIAPMAPANDECVDAIPFPSLPLNGDWVGVSGTTLSATQSQSEDCNGWGNDDVWLSFVVPDGQDRVLFRHNFDNGLVIELYSGECDTLEFIGCYGTANSDAGIRNLIGGDTYYLRLYNSGFYEFTDFEIELSIPQPTPNVDCPTAIPFPAIPTDGSCASIRANNAFATGTGIPLCGEGNPQRDVWFSFVVPEGYTAVNFEMDVHIGYNAHFQLFEGTCDNLVVKECIYSAYIDDFSGLTPGETYWLQVVPIFQGISEFTICMFTPPLPPSNDHCPEALSITSTPGLFLDPGMQTTAGATASDEPVCFPWNGAPRNYAYDVWYSFITDHDGGDATIEVDFSEPELVAYGFFSLHLQGFEGTCGDFSTLSCVENIFQHFGYQDTFVIMNLYGLEPLTQYYFRVFPTGDSENYAPVDFTLSAEGTALMPITGIEDHSPESFSISRLYPSPASDQIIIEYEGEVVTDRQLIITDLLGHEVLRKKGNEHGRDWMHVKDLTPGMYILFVESKGLRTGGKKFIKE
jgi:hypothetical protein